MATALRRALSEPGLAGALSGKGLQRAAQFTWSRTALLTREAWSEAIRMDPVRRGRKDSRS
ncbi:MAG: hypothetical protein U1E27_10585 [Kiritimatiellia bacterium]|nr:hypothetical protein [Kiritimatiellia bacterium]